jgi:hypothetical protein
VQVERAVTSYRHFAHGVDEVAIVIRPDARVTGVMRMRSDLGRSFCTVHSALACAPTAAPREHPFPAARLDLDAHNRESLGKLAALASANASPHGRSAHADGLGALPLESDESPDQQAPSTHCITK